MPVAIIPFRFPGIDNVRCAFQMRYAGNGALKPLDAPGRDLEGGNISYSVGEPEEQVTRNRKDLLAACAGAESWSELNQVHGDAIVFEPQPVAVDGRPQENADGMATSRGGLALLMKTADCQPVFIAHRSGRYVAALHVGWRGDRILFPYTGTRAFCRHYGISPADCVAVRGPSLGPACAQFVHYAKEWGEYFEKYLDYTHSTMDLWSMTRDQLRAAGIPARQIYGLDLCTMSNRERFFSYRGNACCGRQGSLIWIA